MTDEADSRQRRRRIGAAVVLLGAAVVIIVAVMQVRKPKPAPPPAVPPAAATPALPTRAAPGPTPAEAFALVYPTPNQKVTWQGKTYAVRFSPYALTPVPGGFALISLGHNKDDFHAAKGFYSVAYLKGAPLKLDGEILLGSGSDGGNGAPPDIAITPSLSHVSTLVVTSGFMAQGDESRWADLVRLGDRPAVVAERIPLLEDNTGAFADPKDPEVSKIVGHIKGGVKDQAFAVVYQGSWTGAVVWRWDGARWRCTGDRQCPTPRP